MTASVTALSSRISGKSDPFFTPSVDLPVGRIVATPYPYHRSPRRGDLQSMRWANTRASSTVQAWQQPREEASGRLAPREAPEALLGEVPVEGKHLTDPQPAHEGEADTVYQTQFSPAGGED